MITVLAAFLDLNSYREAMASGGIPRPDACPCCGHGRVWFNGTYGRYAQIQTGDEIVRERIRVRRCRCSSCRKGWSLLPGFCLPYKQFGAETVEWALRTSCVEGVGNLSLLRGPELLGPSPRTVRRWMRWVPSLVREECLDRFGGWTLPASRETVAATLSVLRDWHQEKHAADPSPLRACLHGRWGPLQGSAGSRLSTFSPSPRVAR